MDKRPHPLDQVEIRFGIGGGVLVVAALAADTAGLGEEYAALLLLGGSSLVRHATRSPRSTQAARSLGRTA